MKIDEIIQHERDLLNSSSNIRKSFFAQIDLRDANRVWFSIGNRLTNGKYKVDDVLKEPVTQILKWCIMDQSFSGDLQKGLLLSGEIGCGKTLTLKIFVEFMKYANKIVASYSAIEIVEIFKSKEGKDRLFVSPLFIDDLGTEQTEINNYGTKEAPIYEIFNRRYLDRRFLMFITTNLKPSQMEERYGDRVRDRIKEMFNIMPIKGNSRRK
jgi:hypothetical protein